MHINQQSLKFGSGLNTVTVKVNTDPFVKIVMIISDCYRVWEGHKFLMITTKVRVVFFCHKR